MNRLMRLGALLRLTSAGVLACAWITVAATPVQAQERKPNILVIMGDDVGWFNIGAYHQGIMSGKTPNLDKLAADGMRSPTTMPRQAAPRAGPTSSPANCRCAPA